MRDETTWSGIGLVIMAVIGALAGAGAIALGARAAPEGPAPVAWDRTPCAHCTMLVGDRSFAAQLRTDGGDTLVFDDPGCLFAHEAESGPGAAVWFRDARGDGWIEAGHAA